MPLGVAKHKSPIANALKVKKARRRRRQLFGRSVTRIDTGWVQGWVGWWLGVGSPKHMPWHALPDSPPQVILEADIIHIQYGKMQKSMKFV